MWYPVYFVSGTMECHRNYVEEALHVSGRKRLRPVEEGIGCFCESFLLECIHIVLRRRLYAFLAGLDLYKMYSFCIECYDIYLKMSAAPVSFKDDVSVLLQPFASDIFSQLA